MMSATSAGCTRETDWDAEARNATGKTTVVEQIGSNGSIAFSNVLPPEAVMMLRLSYKSQSHANFRASYPGGDVIARKHHLCVTDTWVIQAR